MKLFYALIILILFNNCSLDNKSGIWKNANNVTDKEDDLFKEFEALSFLEKSFDQIIPIKKDTKIRVSTPIKNFEWVDIFYNQTNNYKNIKYKNLNQLIFKSKKISKNKVNNFVLFNNNNLITSDHKGNVIIFSINKNKIIYKFNFYKKEFKKIKKSLNLTLEKNIIYISDNIGFLYALDYEKKKVLWAKNYKIPFRSNLKLSGKTLVASDQNNNLFFINKNSGDILKLVPTEETIIKNDFINNLSSNALSLFFLNTYGSLYSINNKTFQINWFINLNQSIDLNPTNLFTGNQIVNYKDKILVSSNEYTYVFNSINGSPIYKKNFSSQIKPVILDDYIFLITKNNLLISMNLNNGKILYSYDINESIADFLNIKKKSAQFKNIMIINSKIFIFLNNSYLLKFNLKGSIEDVVKLPSKIKSQPIFIDESLIYLDSKNKISIID